MLSNMISHKEVFVDERYLEDVEQYVEAVTDLKVCVSDPCLVEDRIYVLDYMDNTFLNGKEREEWSPNEEAQYL